jgi:cyclic pyranopterin phosphate synthase
MVDVSAKASTLREACAEGRIKMSVAAVTAIRERSVNKGDVLAVARIAGIMAAKNTSQLIPLCHPLRLSGVTLDLQMEIAAVIVSATVRTLEVTGVEMEALSAVSVALLTIYDMAKSIDRGMTIEGIRLLTKSGGRSGNWQA